MMKRRLNLNGRNNENDAAGIRIPSSESKDEQEMIEWEMRPGGMLVQKRNTNSDHSVPNLSVRIVYGALRYEISVNSRATFGELKKLLTAETGLQPAEQKIFFRGKVRQNGQYLDLCGVRDRSKVVLMEDPGSVERRYIEMRRNARLQTVHRFIGDVTVEVDKLEEQVSVIDKSVANGNKVAEVQITTLIEMLMRLAVKLESISAEEDDAATKKNLQGKRIQKCVETLDVLKISNCKSKPSVVTTKWETFDPPPTTTLRKFFG